jgi:hypothetical protein
MLAEAGDLQLYVGFKKHKFSDFFIGPVFFSRNPPPHLRGRVRASFCRERRLKIIANFRSPENVDNAYCLTSNTTRVVQQ